MQYRMPAEWDPHECCWMAWPCYEELWQGHMNEARETYAEVAKAISEFEPVKMLCPPDLIDNAKQLLHKDIEIIPFAIEDSWMRDFGPSFVRDIKTKEICGVDWTFNGWGKYPHDIDKKVATSLLEKLAIKRVGSELVNEGGAIHVDGQGTCMLTETVQLNLNRNPNLKKTDVEKHLQQAIGVDTFIWLPKGLVDDDTDGHIDQLACFVAPGKVLALSSNDPDDANYECLQGNLAFLRSSTDSRGQKLEVLSIEQPPAKYLNGTRLARSYVNFYIANGGIVMPSYADTELDKAALQTVQACFPERKVVQVDCNFLVIGGGNIHCITQQQIRK